MVATDYSGLWAAIGTLVNKDIYNLEWQGGPGQADWAELPTLRNRLFGYEDHPDRILALQYGPKAVRVTKEEYGQMLADLARVIALASFCPGGIEIFGRRFEGRMPPPDPQGQQRSEHPVKEGEPC